MTDEWHLHAQLDTDTINVGDLPLSRLLASRDANYPWLILVPRRPDVTEIMDLSTGDQLALMREINRISIALKEFTRCDKLNVAALGNMVPQLHIHIIARHTNDAAWPKPVWGVEPAREYAPGVLERFSNTIAERIGLPTK